MSGTRAQVRWPWMLVAVVGLGGALLLSVGGNLRLRSNDTAPMRQRALDVPKLKLQSPEGARPQGSSAGHSSTPGTPDPAATGPVAAGPIGPPASSAGDDDAPHGLGAGTIGTGRLSGHGSLGGHPAGEVAGRGSEADTSAAAKENPPAAIDPQKELQQPGRFGLSTPAKMEVGRSEHVTLVAAVDKLRPMVSAELPSDSAGESASQVSFKDLPLSRLLRVELRADSDSDFEIRPFTPAEQRLSSQQVTTWEWSVTPKADGDKHLTVVISNLVDGQGQPIAVTIAHRTVTVAKSLGQWLREVSGTASSATSALAGLIGTWLGLLKPMLQRRKEDENKPQAKPEGGKSGDGKGGDGKPDVPAPGTSKSPPEQTKPPHDNPTANDVAR